MPSLRARLTNAFLRLTLKRQWRPDITVEEVRAHAARSDARMGRGAPPIARESVSAGGVPATWFGEPSLAERGTLLYIHGGAWCMHLPHVYGHFMTRLSLATGMRVLLIEYRLAPEHPFPAGPDDCLAAYRWSIEQGLAARPFVVGGDSAGGNLTAVTLQRARALGLPLPRCAVMLSPATDFTNTSASSRYNDRADPMFTAAASKLVVPTYCEGQDPMNPLLSPLFGDWRGLPPLLFQAGSTEILLDDSIRAQDRARAAGVAAEIEVWFGLPHVHHVMHWLPEAREALDGIAAFTRRHCAA